MRFCILCGNSTEQAGSNTSGNIIQNVFWYFGSKGIGSHPGFPPVPNLSICCHVDPPLAIVYLRYFQLNHPLTFTVVLALAFCCQDLTNRQTNPFNQLVHEVSPRGRMRSGFKGGVMLMSSYRSLFNQLLHYILDLIWDTYYWKYWQDFILWLFYQQNLHGIGSKQRSWIIQKQSKGIGSCKNEVIFISYNYHCDNSQESVFYSLMFQSQTLKRGFCGHH